MSYSDVLRIKDAHEKAWKIKAIELEFFRAIGFDVSCGYWEDDVKNMRDKFGPEWEKAVASVQLNKTPAL